jgi:TatD DNase family protein
MYPLIDTHAHLSEIQDLANAIAGAKSAGITAIIAVGSESESNQRVLALAEEYKGFVYPALGLHPWGLGTLDIDHNLEFIQAHINQAVAIGEIGLDYDKRVRARADKALQMQALREVLRLAQTHNKPALVHSRYAWRDCLDIVAAANIEKVVFHWYTGTSGVLRDIVSHGFFISATPAVEYHDEHRRAVREVPLERLLLETDSPVVYRRGTPSEYQSTPAHIVRALQAVSRLRGMPESGIAAITTDNARRLFGL